MYQVLKPIYEKTGDLTPSGKEYWRVRDWQIIGTAKNMEDAKRRHYAPVLHWAPRAA